MEAELERIRGEALAEIGSVVDRAGLEAARLKYLGRKGSLPALSERMREVAPADKARVGKLMNEVRVAISSALDGRVAGIEASEDARAFEALDLSLPGIAPSRGSIHPLSRLLDRVVSICRRMGFSLASGPDIETEWHCFDALNTPPDHPARNEQDTFYLPDGRLLRTHTSTVQIRTMEAVAPPVRVISPGAAYRRDEIDATHLAQFHQVEGLAVDREVTLGDLKGTLERFFRELLGPDAECRFRPHFFPFTEPSYEVDVRAQSLGGRWLEMAGCGMVDPAVFEAVNARRGDRAYDPEAWTGFAFGIGIERLAMVLYRVPDIRLFSENDLRFLAQFAQ